MRAPRKDITGQRFTRLVAIHPVERPAGRAKSKGTHWQCQCDCGREAVVNGCDLRQGSTRSCGCLKTEASRHSELFGGVPDLTGMVVGKLLVIERHVAHGWLAKCECGRECYAKTAELLRGANGSPKGKRSCGCIAHEFFKSVPEEQAGRTRLWHQYLGNARHRNLSFTLSREEFFRIVKRDCHYCGTPPSTVANSKYRNRYSSFVYNGIDRVDNGKGYDPGNVVPCCAVCNIAKSTLGYGEFLAWIKRAYLHISQEQALAVSA